MGISFMNVFLLTMVLGLYPNAQAVAEEVEYTFTVESRVEGLQILDWRKVYSVEEFYEELVKLQKEGKYSGKNIVFPEFTFSENFYGKLAVFLMNPDNFFISDNSTSPVQKIKMFFKPINGIEYVWFKLL